MPQPPGYNDFLSLNTDFKSGDFRKIFELQSGEEVGVSGSCSVHRHKFDSFEGGPDGPLMPNEMGIMRASIR